MSLLNSCLNTSHDAIITFSNALSGEGAALVDVAREMQEGAGSDGRMNLGNGTWEFGAGAAGGWGRSGWGYAEGEGEGEGGAKRVLLTVQRLCDVIDAQKGLVGRMRDVRGRVVGLLGEVGLDGVGVGMGMAGVEEGEAGRSDEMSE